MLDRFLNGKVAFMDLWEAPRALFLEQKMHENYPWAIIDLPTGPGPTINFSLTHPLVIAIDSKHHAEAWEFLRFFGTEGQAVFGENGFFPLTRASIRRMVQKTPLPPGHSEQDIFGPLINPAGVPVSHRFFLPGFAEVWAEVENAWTRTVTENVSVRVALEAARLCKQRWHPLAVNADPVQLGGTDATLGLDSGLSVAQGPYKGYRTMGSGWLIAFQLNLTADTFFADINGRKKRSCACKRRHLLLPGPQCAG